MNLPPVLKQRFFDANGAPLAGGKLYTYAAGTSTLQPTYTDQGGLTPNANPIVLDANGEASMWLNPALSYKFVLKTSADVTQWTVDNVIGILTPDAVNTDSIQDGAVTIDKLSDVLTANQILGANAAGTALEGKTVTAGSNITLTQSVGGLEIASPGVDSISQHLDDFDSGIKAGEALTNRNAVCLDLNGSVYKYFKCDADLASRRNNFLGFAKANATVTAHIQTYTASAAFVASNLISIDINGRGYSVVYASSSDDTLAAIATQIALDPNIVSATVTPVVGTAGTLNRQIVVTGRGGLTITIVSVVTLGVSQPTVTMATTQAPNGDLVDCHSYGPLDGFSGLTQGAYYYLSGTAGGITASPTDSSPILIGQALNTTVLYVFLYTALRFGTSALMVRALGSSTNAAAGAVQDVEHFNFSSWATGTSSSAGVVSKGIVGGAADYNSFLHCIDGVDAASSLVTRNQRYNKTSWGTVTSRATSPGSRCTGAYSFSGYLYISKGHNGASLDTAEKWNGSAWTAISAFGTANYLGACFTQGGLAHWTGGADSQNHDTLNSSDVAATATANPGTSSYKGGSAIAPGSLGVILDGAGASGSYTWNGSAWSSSLAVSYTVMGTAEQGSAAAYDSGTQRTYVNGGSTGAAAIGTSGVFNGTSWSAGVSSNTARSGATAGVL